MNRFILQTNFNDQAYTQLVSDINYIAERKNLKVDYLDIIPFNDDYNIHADINDNVLYYGSQTVIDSLKNKNYKPVGFTNNMNFNIWLNHLGSELLNYDSTVDELKNLDSTLPIFFIRPLLDTKTLTGSIMTKHVFSEWKNMILDLDEYCYSTINKDTVFIISSIKNIVNEYRFFVVNGKIITASMYIDNYNRKYNKHVPVYVYEYVNSIIDIWEPDIAYCIDIGELDNHKLKVIEYNSITTCGLYASDTFLYAESLINLLED